MKRAPAPILAALGAVALLSACKRKGEPDVASTDVPAAVANATNSANIVESKYGTPVKDRVGTLGLLNKRNNIEQDLVMKPGEAKRVGNVVVRLVTCERTLPWEEPPETGAFAQVYVEERSTTSEPLAWHRVFSGWLFKNSPSLNVVEHPVYDVWVKDCAMKFPGEEENPADAASASTKPKPAVSAAPSPKPSASGDAASAPSADATD
jgi:hypothetical protein